MFAENTARSENREIDTGGWKVYQVLFAEDELLVRLGLQNSIPWENYDMELTAQADNGITAFELFQKLRPDVVLTDIRMEGMDGYELIEKIREIDEECAIIVISCLDDFETLRKMIPYKIIGYILKASMSMKEIYDVLQETKDYLERTGRKGLRRKKKETMSLEQTLAEYLSGEGEMPEWNGEKHTGLILDFYLEDTEKEKINELAMKFIYELVNRQVQGSILVETGEKEFCLLVSGRMEDVDEKIERINRSTEGFLGVRFCVNTGKREPDETLRELYLRLQSRRKAEKPEERKWDRLIQRAVYYMREHHEESLSLPEISGILGISPSYFSHLFKRETGTNYVEFLNQIRLEEVLKDLQNSSAKIVVVADNHGFHNPEYFSRFFKKSMGISPAKWRQQNK